MYVHMCAHTHACNIYLIWGSVPILTVIWFWELPDPPSQGECCVVLCDPAPSSSCSVQLLADHWANWTETWVAARAKKIDFTELVQESY